MKWSKKLKMGCCWVTSFVSDSVRTHGWQPTRMSCPWDSPGKNTGVGCHFLHQCMKAKSENEVTQSCLTLSDPMDCSLPGSSIHGIYKARVLEWGAIPSLKNGILVYKFFNVWKIKEDIPKEPIFQSVSNKGNNKIIWVECKWKHF